MNGRTALSKRKSRPLPSAEGDATAWNWAERQVRLLETEVERQVAERTVTLERICDSERRVAQTLRRALLSPLPNGLFGALAVEAACAPVSPQEMVGGDFYDAFRLDDDTVALVVGDVCGSGLGAAMRVPEIKWGLRPLLHEERSPARALTRLNEWQCAAQELLDPYCVSTVALTLVLIDLRRWTGVCAVAGADPPLILRADGAAETVAIGGPPLAVIADSKYGEVSFGLGPEDLLVMVTDGLTEARQGREFFGHGGLARFAADRVGERTEAEGHGLHLGRSLLGAAYAFAGGSLHDDACVLVAGRTDARQCAGKELES